MVKKKTAPKKFTIKQIAKVVVPILKNKGIKKAGIFGSYARGEAKKRSDIDILVQPPRGMGFEFFALNFELEEKLGKKVDLLTYKSVSPYLKKYIMADEVRIL